MHRHFSSMYIKVNWFEYFCLEWCECKQGGDEQPVFAGSSRKTKTYLAGLLALHDLEDGVFEGVVDKGRSRGLHVLLHQSAGEGGRSEQCRGLIWSECMEEKKKKVKKRSARSDASHAVVEESFWTPRAIVMYCIVRKISQKGNSVHPAHKWMFQQDNVPWNTSTVQELQEFSSHLV